MLPPKTSPTKPIAGSFDSLSLSDEATSPTPRSRKVMPHSEIDAQIEEASDDIELTVAECTISQLTGIPFCHNFNLTEGESGQLTFVEVDSMSTTDFNIESSTLPHLRFNLIQVTVPLYSSVSSGLPQVSVPDEYVVKDMPSDRTRLLKPFLEESFKIIHTLNRLHDRTE